MQHTVLVVDDHAEYRVSVRALLVAAGFDVVGEAGTGAEALEAVGRLGPDVVLLDVRLPDIDGITVAASVALLPEPPTGGTGVQSRPGGIRRSVAERPGTGISRQE